MSEKDSGKEESILKTFRILSVVFTVAFAIVSVVLLAVHSYTTAGLMIVLAGGCLIATFCAFESPVSMDEIEADIKHKAYKAHRIHNEPLICKILFALAMYVVIPCGFIPTFIVIGNDPCSAGEGVSMAVGWDVVFLIVLLINLPDYRKGLRDYDKLYAAREEKKAAIQKKEVPEVRDPATTDLSGNQIKKGSKENEPEE